MRCDQQKLLPPRFKPRDFNGQFRQSVYPCSFGISLARQAMRFLLVPQPDRWRTGITHNNCHFAASPQHGTQRL
ncbi:hypothetical protein ACFQX7_30930 [Luedemannella flava]